MWNLALLILLLIYLKHKRFDGEIALLYFAGYGIGRALIESIRTDQLYITGTTIPVSMMLGIVMASASIIAIICIRASIRKKASDKKAVE
jgi:phosphatidylglycerol:prolipoprotein diacylglycerol transferase